MIILTQFIRTKKTQMAAAATALVASAQTYAVDTADIDAAYTAGGTAVAAAVAGVVGLVALVVGVNMVISMLKKG
ncbi:hypothetical protein [Microbulbifer sp. DLAB2-AA]|uniref:hypothetical protein n=1 Tax=Microbulbifer sp. DLAB2-AA TaxID=3243394 RepID=UPI0040395B51